MILCIFGLILIQLKNNRELFITGSDNFQYKNIDRISNGNHTFSYCIGGKATCNNKPLLYSPVIITDLSADDYYTGGNTYKAYCNDNTGAQDTNNPVICDGSMFSKLNKYSSNSNSMSNYQLPADKDGAPTLSFPISPEFVGFTIPYSYVPAELDKTDPNLLLFYKNQSKDVQLSMNICDAYYQTDADNCRIALNITKPTPKIDTADPGSYSPLTGITYGISPDDNTDTTDYSNILGINGTIDIKNNDVNIPVDKQIQTSSTLGSPKYPATDCDAKIPCIADFGTEIGDKLCCGQLGTLKNTKYICPANKPKCTKFNCKTQLGYCQ